MSLSSTQLQDLKELLSSLRETRLDSQQSARLNMFLRDHAEARRLYLEHFYLASMLRWLHDDLTTELSEPSAKPVPVVPLKPKALRVPSYLWSRILVAACFYGVFALFAWSLRSDKFVPTEHPEQHGIAQNPAAMRVATIKQLANVTWSAKSARPGEDQSINSGEMLEIDAGSLVLELTGGANLQVQGPASWMIDDVNRATLENGKFVAKVPKRAIGFTVDTPAARVIDLGTEFGVDVSSAKTEVHVLEGEVSASIKSSSSNGQAMRLAKGEAIQVETQAGGEIAVKSMPASRQHFAGSVARAPRKPRTPVKAQIEAGDASFDYVFPTLPGPSNRDVADASLGKAKIQAIGKLRLDQATSPAEALIDGQGSKGRHVCFADPKNGKLLIDLGQRVRVDRTISFSWNIDGAPIQSPQGYDLFGCDSETAPSTDGYLPKQGWEYIATINTETVLGHPPNCPSQQAVSISREDGSPLGEFRYLLWVTDRHRQTPTSFDEIDVYGETVNGEKE